MDSNENSESLFENSGIVILITAGDGRIISANKAACKLFDMTGEEICRLGISGLMDMTDAGISGLMEQREKTGQATGELTLLRKNGLKFQAEVSMSFFHDSQGEELTTMIIRDLTGQKLAEEKILRLNTELEEIVSQRSAEINAFYDTATNGLCIIDKDLRVIRVNSQFAQITGRPHHEHRGRTIMETLPEMAEEVTSILRSVIDTGKPLRDIEIEGETAADPGVKHAWLLQCYPLTGRTGAVRKIYLVAEDVTERKRDEKQLKLLSRSVAQSPVSIVVTGIDGRIEYVNPTFSRVSRYEAGEVMGKSLSMLKSGYHSTEFYKDLWDTILSGKDWAGEIRNKNKNGELYWIQAIISPIANDEGEITNFVSIREDITERKNLYEDLVIAKEKAEESDRLKSAFLANISHEIRTPMNGIMGFTHILKESGLSRPDQRRFVDIIQASGKRMLDTVNDLIDISRIESGQVKLNVTSFKPSRQLKNIFAFFKPQAEQKGLELILKEWVPPEAGNIKTDCVKLDSILTNLIKNAIKFTDRGKIEVGCRLKGNFLEYYVKDTGIGVPSGKKEAIFNRFEQADMKDSKSFQGSGLGLAIAKAYVELMGGEIWFESLEGDGSTFYFTVLLQKAEARKRRRDQNEMAEMIGIPRLAGKKILIAEDDPYSLEMIVYLLSKTGATLITAKDGRETVDEFVRDSFDLVLLDIRLPGINGYEVLKEIRMRDQEVPVIAQSAYALPADIRSFKSEGFNDYVTKPVAREKLYGLLSKYLCS